jgi:FkbM family methyltransferase
LQQVFIDHTCLQNKLDFYLLFKKKLNETGTELLSDINNLVESKSQNGQDLFALLTNNFKKNGVFIEFGAYDGVIFSNTHLLEKHFGWNGILIDPIPSHYKKLKLHRKCKIIHGAITAEQHENVLIEETAASDLSKFVIKRKFFKKIHKVKAFTLSQVMNQCLTADQIDFLSIDTEGTELEILKSIDLNRYKINSVCVEHNFREGSEEMVKYMVNNGYEHLYGEYSKNDYWFVLKN